MDDVPVSPHEPKSKAEEAAQDAFWRGDSGESGHESSGGSHGHAMDGPPAYTP